MSLTSFPESADSASDLKEPGCEPSPSARTTPTVKRSSGKHWPDIPIFGRIEDCSASLLPGGIGLISGGFPCQDISIAGDGAGIEGNRSGLWREFKRIIGEVRPRFVIVENVAALLGRGFSRVLGDLAALGYDAEWHCIPAAYVGAHHIRDRVWILAYSSSYGFKGPILNRDSISQAGVPFDWGAPQRAYKQMDWRKWATESPILGKDDDVPNWMDRVDACGNAVVPQIPEIIGRVILKANGR